MRPHQFRDLIVRAMSEPSGKTMDLLVAQLRDAERARQILRAKGYGCSGMSASCTAAQVPNAPLKRSAT